LGCQQFLTSQATATGIKSNRTTRTIQWCHSELLHTTENPVPGG
jgi:hypothetical protein